MEHGQIRPSMLGSDSHTETNQAFHQQRGCCVRTPTICSTASPPQRCVCSLCSSDKHPWATAPRQRTSLTPGRSPRPTPSSYFHEQYLQRRSRGRVKQICEHRAQLRTPSVTFQAPLVTSSFCLNHARDPGEVNKSVSVRDYSGHKGSY